MKQWTKIALVFASISLGSQVCAQEELPADAYSQSVDIPKPVYFKNTSGENLLVPAGAYWVTPGDDSLELTNLDDEKSFAIAAIAGTHDEILVDPIAISIAGPDEQPDAHIIEFLRTDGTQLAGAGSYSGVRARGLPDSKSLLEGARIQLERQRQVIAKVNALALAEGTTEGEDDDVVAPDAINRTVLIKTPVYFDGIEGEVVLVPIGSYWVTPEDGFIELFNLGTTEIYAIAAAKGEHEDSLSEVVANSTPGTAEIPDVHMISVSFADGSQLVASGSYSGVRTRGRLADRARQAAAAARQETARRAAMQRQRAQRLAAEAKRRAQTTVTQAQQIAQASSAEAQRRVDAAKEQARRAAAEAERLKNLGTEAARRRANEILAGAQRRVLRELNKIQAELIKQASDAFESLPPEKKRELIRMADTAVNQNLPLIKEFANRLVAVQRKYSLTPREFGRLSDRRKAEILQEILGQGEDRLPLPGESYVRTRGADKGGAFGDRSGFSVSLGSSADAAAVVGVGLGKQYAIGWGDTAVPGVIPALCKYFMASGSFGAQVTAGISVDGSIWASGAPALGSYFNLNPMTWSAPGSGNFIGNVRDSLVVAIFSGVDVGLSVSVRATYYLPTINELREEGFVENFRLVGFTVSVGAGVGAEILSGEIGSTYRLLPCTDRIQQAVQ